jgi:hypothetical protein
MCLSINIEHRLIRIATLLGELPQRGQPAGKTGLKGFWIHRQQDASEKVFGRNAVGQRQRFQQKVLLIACLCGDGGWSSGSGQHSHERDH